MSDILETYQEEQEIQEAPEASALIASIISIDQNGVGLRFDGSTADSSKSYPRNTGVVLSVGQRVIVQKINGEFVVMAPVGAAQDANVVSKADLNDYATKAELSEYAKTTDLDAYAKTTDLKTFVMDSHSTGGFNTAAGGSNTSTLYITKANYKPIGVVGVKTNETANNQIVIPTQFYLSASNNGNGTITYGWKNVGTTALNSVVFTFYVLWISV